MRNAVQMGKRNMCPRPLHLGCVALLGDEATARKWLTSKTGSRRKSNYKYMGMFKQCPRRRQGNAAAPVGVNEVELGHNVFDSSGEVKLGRHVRDER